MDFILDSRSTDEEEDTDNVCVICQSNIITSEAFVKLSCHHWYHINCLKQVPDSRCPTCRQETNELYQPQTQAYSVVELTLATTVHQLVQELTRRPTRRRRRRRRQSSPLNFPLF